MASPGSRLAALRSDAEQILQSLFQDAHAALPPSRGGNGGGGSGDGGGSGGGGGNGGVGGGFAAEAAPGLVPRPVRA